MLIARIPLDLVRRELRENDGSLWFPHWRYSIEFSVAVAPAVSV